MPRSNGKSYYTKIVSLFRNWSSRLGHEKWLILAGILMYLLFVASPMQLNKKYASESTALVNSKISQLKKGDCYPVESQKSGGKSKGTAESGGKSKGTAESGGKSKGTAESGGKSNDSCQALLKGLEIQLGKANTEIQNRLNQETEWFKIKYLYVGVILLGFLINTFFKESSIRPEHVNHRFQMAGHSYVTSFILSLSVIVAVSIDMQIRSGRIVINQLGSWIFHYAEPILLGNDLGWEAFLRLDGGYHANTVYTMTFWPNIYYLSIGLYLLYLVVSRKALGKYAHRNTVWLGFWLLHITLLVAALSSHVVPYTFQVNPHPIIALFFPSFFVHPAVMIPIGLFSWSILTFVAFYYISPPQKTV